MDFLKKLAEEADKVPGFTIRITGQGAWLRYAQGRRDFNRILPWIEVENLNCRPSVIIQRMRDKVEKNG